MNNLNYTGHPNPSASHNQPTEDARLNKSFIDNKPMIQGLVRSVLKV